MKSFNQFIIERGEGGAKPGKIEIAKSTLDAARKYSIKQFAKFGRDLDVELPNHDENFNKVKYRAGLGRTKRKDMPVIAPNDIRALQSALKKGTIDVSAPYSTETDPNNPFPEGLTGIDAKEFFQRGLRVHDGAKPDDKVGFKKAKVEVQKLIPIQQQIYYDKSIDKLAQFGAKSSKKFHQSTIFLTSSDLRIIDGHHRFLSALLVDPNQKVQLLMVDLPIEKLLPLTLAFGDARGNKRNA